MKTSTEIQSIAQHVGEHKAVEYCAKAGFDGWDFSMFNMCQYLWPQDLCVDSGHPLRTDNYLKFVRELVAKGCNIQLEKEGLAHLSVTAEELKRQFGKALSANADSIFSSVPAPECYALLERCIASEFQVLREDPCYVDYPGVRENIAKLAENHRLFIVSNCEKGYPELCMEKLGIGKYIQDHLCYGDTGTSKGKIILTLMARNNIKSAIYIDDTQGDYTATVEAGLPFVWCTHGFGIPEGYAAKVDNFAELLNLL